MIRWKGYPGDYIELRSNLDVVGYKKQLALFEKRYKQENKIDEIFVKYQSGANKGKYRIKK